MAKQDSTSRYDYKTAQRINKALIPNQVKREQDAKLSEEISRWNVSDNDILIARTKVNAAKTELKALSFNENSTRAQYTRAKNKVKKAEAKLIQLKEKQAIKRIVNNNPNKSPSDIQKEYQN